MPEKPFAQIKKNISSKIPKDLINYLPDKWEKIGDVLTIVLPKILERYKENIAESYASTLDCKTVLNDVGGISGEYREPNVEILFGPNDTETTHKENGVKYKLDPQKIMFSSGNMEERIRMGKTVVKNEVVVDLFAGIGYFSLPIAVHGRPKKVFAVEKNPVSFNYLSKNITLNNVSSIVEPIHGDNRIVAPKNVADRVIMGYFDTIVFLPIGIECLKNRCGVIHFHDKFSDDFVPDTAFEKIEKAVEKYDRHVDLIDYKCVKSYAPGISHYVFDLKVGEK